MAHLNLNGVKKVYPNGMKAIHGVDVEITDGELIVLVGPSGCGKSTLLRMIGGLETVSEGTVLIDGKVVNDLEPADRDIAMVFQNYALYPHMSVYNNMAYGLKNRRVPKAEIKRRVTEAAEILDLTDDQLARKPRQLSGGQRQRVAMGRAIVREPSVFLFDEPLSNLDAKLRVQMRLEIKKLQERLGVTSVYVTHDQVEAMTLGHRLIVLNDGIVEQLGTPMDIYDSPASVFVAGFIGSPSMNFISTQLSSDGLSVELSGVGRLNVLRPDLAAQGGREVTLGIRPEHMLVAEDTGQTNGVAHLTITLIEHLGADTLVHGHFGEDKSDLTIRLPGAQVLSTGDIIPLTVSSEQIHLFDSQTQKRI